MAQTARLSSLGGKAEAFIGHPFSVAEAVPMLKDYYFYTYTLELGEGDPRCPYGYIKYHDDIAQGCLTVEEVAALEKAGEIDLRLSIGDVKIKYEGNILYQR
jgi:hypothetical protein